MNQPIIAGSWIDIVHPNARDGVYWNRKTIAYTDADWQRLISHLRHDLGCEILVLENIAVHDGWFLYPSKLPHAKQWPRRGSPDPVGAILSAAAAEQMLVFVGVGVYPRLASCGYVPSRADKADSMRWSREVAEELLERYGHLASFHGFYTTSELFFNPQTGLLPDEQVEWARSFSETLHAVRPGVPVLTAPFHCWNIAKTQPDSGALARCITDTGVDIFVPQDGVGFDRPDCPRPVANSAEAFRRIAEALRGKEIRFWAHVEVFRFENDLFAQPLLPGSFARIERQLAAVAPYVEKITCYQMPGLMTSQKVCPDLGAPETETLYQAYRRYLDKVQRATP